jgi:CBS domain-containing protein
MTVADLMTSPVLVVRVDATARAALLRMRRADVRHLAVTDADLRLVGVLSDRDLVRVSPPGRRVRALMTGDVLTVRPETLAREASALLLDHKIGALPVVDEEGRVVGMITETDFVRVAHQALGGG